MDAIEHDNWDRLLLFQGDTLFTDDLLSDMLALEPSFMFELHPYHEAAMLLAERVPSLRALLGPHQKGRKRQYFRAPGIQGLSFGNALQKHVLGWRDIDYPSSYHRAVISDNDYEDRLPWIKRYA